MSPCEPCTRNSGGLDPDVWKGISIGLFHASRSQLIDLAGELLDGRRVDEGGCGNGNREFLFDLDEDAGCQQGIDAEILVAVRDPHTFHAEHVAPEFHELALA